MNNRAVKSQSKKSRKAIDTSATRRDQRAELREAREIILHPSLFDREIFGRAA